MTRFAVLASAISVFALAGCGDSPEATAAGEAATEALVGGAEAPDPGADAEGGAARMWTVDYTLSTLGVAGEYGANPFTGKFNDWSADIVFSPENLEGSSVRVEVQVASFESGDSSRDEAAVSDRWLNAEAFPTAVFESTGVEESGDGYVAHGTLSIAGVSNPVDLNFTVEIDGDMAHATGSTEFDHHPWIAGGYDDSDTGDIFSVNFDITATAQ